MQAAHLENGYCSECCGTWQGHRSSVKTQKPSTNCPTAQWWWVWWCWSSLPASRKSLTVSYVPQDTAAAGALNSTRGFMPRQMVDQPSSAMIRLSTGNCRQHSKAQHSTTGGHHPSAPPSCRCNNTCQYALHAAAVQQSPQESKEVKTATDTLTG